MSIHTPYRPLDITIPFPELRAWARTATRLHPIPGSPTAADSSVGGPLLWPADEEWPVCGEHGPGTPGIAPERERRYRRILREVDARPRTEDGGLAYTDEERAELDALSAEPWHQPDRHEGGPSPLLALAQFYARDIPDLAPFAPPGTDLLHVLWCPYYEHADGPFSHFGPYTRLYWRRAADVTEPLAVMPEPAVAGRGRYLPEPCVLRPEQVVEYPYVDYLPEELGRRIEAWEDELRARIGDAAPWYQYDLSLAPGWKIGGWDSWHTTDLVRVYCDACGTEMRVLLTIDSYESHAAEGSWGPFPSPDTPTAVKVGRDGEYRAFVCPTDPSHPHRMSMQ
ncbi:hypothetical protein ABZ135_34280 [Streptomyces sp. NPDC006339]|uniref:hypothetical protein n=1 Tax=Streptomyces sp. NPDC006339 TaxID=3156755 RepID=UPI0033A1065D